MTDTVTTSAEAGSLADLQREGRLLSKVGSLPVVVFWHEGRAFAIEDRCPHLGFPLHQGTVEAGLAHLPLAPRALRSRVGMHARPLGRRRAGLRRRDRAATTCSSHRASTGDPVGHLQQRLRDGLEEGITLVIAKVGARVCSSAGVPASRSCAPASSSACTLPRATGGVPASRCSSRWPTSSPSSTPPTERSHSCTAWRSSRRDTRGQAPRFADRTARRTDDRRRRSAGRLVPALRRHAVVGRGRARARDGARRPGRFAHRCRGL